jgi:CheY-like chemotaxis protein
VKADETTEDSPTRLLLVDDEPDVLSTLGEILQEYGYAVVSTWGGEEAVEIASLYDPNVVVTDFRLPGIDGVTMVRRLRERRPNMRAILVSGHISGQARKRANQEQIQRILEKPLSVPELLREIRQLEQREKVAA